MCIRDRPLFERARKLVYAQMEDHLAYLAANPGTGDRDDRIRALIECPQPLVGLFSSRFATADLDLRQLMLEILTERYYRAQTLTGLSYRSLAGQRYVSAEYEEEGKPIHLFTAHAEYSQLAETARGLVPLLQQVPDCLLYTSRCV